MQKRARGTRNPRQAPRVGVSGQRLGPAAPTCELQPEPARALGLRRPPPRDPTHGRERARLRLRGAHRLGRAAPAPAPPREQPRPAILALAEGRTEAGHMEPSAGAQHGDGARGHPEVAPARLGGGPRGAGRPVAGARLPRAGEPPSVRPSVRPHRLQLFAVSELCGCTQRGRGEEKEHRGWEGGRKGGVGERRGRKRENGAKGAKRKSA